MVCGIALPAVTNPRSFDFAEVSLREVSATIKMTVMGESRDVSNDEEGGPDASGGAAG